MTVLFDNSVNNFDTTKGHYSIKKEKQQGKEVTKVYADTSSRIGRFFKRLIMGHDYNINSIGDALTKSVEYDKASKVAQNILDKMKFEEPSSKTDTLGYVLLTNGEKLYTNGQYDKAIKCFVLALMTGHTEAISYLSKYLYTGSLDRPSSKYQRYYPEDWACDTFRLWAEKNFPEHTSWELKEAFRDSYRSVTYRSVNKFPHFLGTGIQEALVAFAKELNSLENQKLITRADIPRIFAMAREIFAATHEYDHTGGL